MHCPCCSEHHCRSFSSHRLSCCMKFNRPRCSHACLLLYGSSRVSSAIGKNNRNSEWSFIIKWEPLFGTGTNFPKKMKHHIFFQSDFWADIYVVFYWQNRQISITLMNLLFRPVEFEEGHANIQYWF